MGASYQWTSEDLDVLVQLARARGVDPFVPALAFFFESAGFDPAAVNPRGVPVAELVAAHKGAYGTNQLSFANLAAEKIDPAEYVTRSIAGQLPVIFGWLDGVVRDFARGAWPSDPGELEALNWLPAFYESRALAGKAIATEGDAYYGSNVPLDPDRTGTTTLATIRVALERAKSNPRWPALERDLDAAIARAGGSTPGPAPGPPSPVAPPAPSPPGPGRGGAAGLLAVLAIAGLFAWRGRSLLVGALALLHRGCA